jgi:putative FmdB family regulatory protein
MPTYEYACSSCGNTWEEIQKITAPAVEECPACHKATAKRQISGGSFILKGGGWYSDLYASSPKSSTPKDDSSSKSGDAGAASGAGGSGESKAETKSESAPKTSETKKDSGSSSGSSGSSGSGGGTTKSAD